MDMAPEHGAHLIVPIHGLQELLRVMQADLVHPCTAHGQRMMVHADQDVLAGKPVKRCVQTPEVGRSQGTSHFPLQVRV